MAANLFISSVYSHEGCYKSMLLLAASKYVRNGAVIAQEVCFDVVFKVKCKSLSTRTPTGSRTATDALVL